MKDTVAGTLSPLLPRWPSAKAHHTKRRVDRRFPPSLRVMESGCGLEPLSVDISTSDSPKSSPPPSPREGGGPSGGSPLNVCSPYSRLVSSPLRRHLALREEMKGSSRLSLESLLDSPQALLAIVECLPVRDVGVLCGLSRALYAFSSDSEGNEVWKMCWSRPWVRGYIANLGARDAK